MYHNQSICLHDNEILDECLMLLSLKGILEMVNEPGIVSLWPFF